MNQTQSPYTISVVLVRSIYPSNIGAVSRAMSNMGAHQLYLIDRKCEVDYNAQLAAATGQEGLQKRIEFSSMTDFLNSTPPGLRVAMTARDGRSRVVHDFKSTLENLKSHPHDSESKNNVYLFFGPEDCGLSFQDVQECHYCCSLPTYGENWSLNLAQAVLLSLFILRDSWGGTRTALDGQFRSRDLKLHNEEYESNLLPENTLKLWLETLGFDLTKRRVNVYTILKRLFLHNVPSPKETRILETVLQQNIRKLQQSQNKQKSKNIKN